MNIVAYIISGMTIAITIWLLTVTIIPVVQKKIQLKTKKPLIWFITLMVIALFELVAIVGALLGETTEYIVPAPSYIWLIFKIFSLIFLWIWSFLYFFIWLKLKTIGGKNDYFKNEGKTCSHQKRTN